ncbi:hypothetical protein AMECASPLE_002657, partial [Ameca splendens]
GTSLEEQVRRIKDIEAIESDSFVPQAFKSSRDDTKVRSVSLSVQAPHSLSFYFFLLLFLLNFALCDAAHRLSRDGPDQIKHSYSMPFVPDPRRFHQNFSTAAAPQTKATAGGSAPVSPTLCTSLPCRRSGCSDADQMQRSLLKCFCPLKELELDLSGLQGCF